MDIRSTQPLKILAAKSNGLFAGREDSLCRESGISTEPAGWVTTPSRPKRPSSAIHGRTSSASSAGRSISTTLSVDHQRPVSATTHRKDSKESLRRDTSQAFSVDEHGDDDGCLSENAGSRRSSKRTSGGLRRHSMNTIVANKFWKDAGGSFEEDASGPYGLLLTVQAFDVLPVEVLQYLLAQPAMDLDAVNSAFGWSSLHFLANNGKSYLMKRIIDASASVATVCHQGNTALIFAARCGYLEAVELLLEAKSKVNAKNKNGWTALTWSAINGHEEVVLALLRVAAQVDVPDLQGRTAAMWAARHGFVDIVHDLLHVNVNLTLRDGEGFTLHDHAQDQVELRKCLLQIQATNSHLLESSKRNNVDSVSQALAAGAHVNVADELGWTSLRWALTHESADMTRLLVKHGARLSEDQENQAMPLDLKHLQLLDRTNLAEELSLLLGSSYRLLAAARKQQWDLVAKELRHGAYVDGKDDEFRTVLMWAATFGAADAVTLLIDSDAALHRRDRHGWAAIHFAVGNGSVETVSLLYYFGADLSITTHDGSRLPHIAAHSGHGAALQLLLVARADIESQNMDGDTPLQVAARVGSVLACNTLLAYGADPLAKNVLSRIPLATTAIAGHLAVAQAMVQPATSPLPVVSEEHLEALYENMTQQEFKAWHRFSGLGDIDDTASAISTARSSKSSKMSSSLALPRSRRGSKRLNTVPVSFKVNVEHVGKTSVHAADGPRSSRSSHISKSPRSARETTPSGQHESAHDHKMPARHSLGDRSPKPTANRLSVDDNKISGNSPRLSLSSQGSARKAVLTLKTPTGEHGHGESIAISPHPSPRTPGSSLSNIANGEHSSDTRRDSKKKHEQPSIQRSVSHPVGGRHSDQSVHDGIGTRRKDSLNIPNEQSAVSRSSSKGKLSDCAHSERSGDGGLSAKKKHSLDSPHVQPVLTKNSTSRSSLNSGKHNRSTSLSQASEASVGSLQGAPYGRRAPNMGSPSNQPVLSKTSTCPATLSMKRPEEAPPLSRSKTESSCSRRGFSSINKMSLARTKIAEEDEDQLQDMHSRTRFGKYTLILSTYFHHDYIAKNIAKPKAPKLFLESADVDGRVPLALASHSCHADIVSFLLKKKAPVDVPDKQGNTALILAAAQNDRFSVERLMLAEPKVSWQNAKKKSAVDVTCDNVIKLILQKHLVKTKVPNKGATPKVDPSLFLFRLEGLPQLSAELLQGHIRALLRRLNAAEPVRVDVKVDPFTACPLGYAFVEYDSAEKASRLMSGSGDALCDTTVRIFQEQPSKTSPKK